MTNYDLTKVGVKQNFCTPPESRGVKRTIWRLKTLNYYYFLPTDRRTKSFFPYMKWPRMRFVGSAGQNPLPRAPRCDSVWLARCYFSVPREVLTRDRIKSLFPIYGVFAHALCRVSRTKSSPPSGSSNQSGSAFPSFSALALFIFTYIFKIRRC